MPMQVTTHSSEVGVNTTIETRGIFNSFEEGFYTGEDQGKNQGNPPSPF